MTTRSRAPCATKRNFARFSGAAVLVATAGISTPASADVAGLFKYAVKSVTATELPNFGGNESDAYDINNAGQIVGVSQNSAGVDNAFLLHPSGSLQNLGTAVSSENSYALGINNNGEVVGGWVRNGLSRPFYWHSSTGFVKLSINLIPGAAYNNKYWFLPLAINDHGFISGSANGNDTAVPYTTCTKYVSIYWPSVNQDPQVLYCKKTPGGNVAEGSDVNNTGWIGGHELSGDFFGYVYKPNGTGGLQYMVAPDPDVPNVRVRGINEAGTLVGQAGRKTSTGTEQRASMWEGPAFTHKYLGMLPGGKYSYGAEINDQGFVVGSSEKALYLDGAYFGMTSRAFIWHKEFGMYELPAPATIGGASAATCSAHALNNLIEERGGWVVNAVGYCLVDLLPRAVRWSVHLHKVAPEPQFP